MRIFKCAMAFVLVFCLLAVTVVCSAVATSVTLALVANITPGTIIRANISVKNKVFFFIFIPFLSLDFITTF